MMDLYTFFLQSCSNIQLFILNKFYITQYIKFCPAIGGVTSTNQSAKVQEKSVISNFSNSVRV